MTKVTANLSSGQKLYGGFGFVLAVSAILGVVVLISMGSMNGRSRDVTGTVMPSVGAVDDTTKSMETLVRHQREHLNTAALADKREVAREIKSNEADVAS